VKKTTVPLVKEGDERSPLEKIPKDSAQRHTFKHNSISATWLLVAL
jgi:hypothetical protein